MTAQSGEDAILYYIEHAPDCVFLDIHLPGLSGLETLSALRRIDAESFIVMLSVDSVETNIKQARQSGAAYFLKKPITKERILEVARLAPGIKERQKN